MFRRLAAFALVALLLVLTGCGGSDDPPPPPPDPLAEALTYLPREALAVSLISTQRRQGMGAALYDRLGRLPAAELVRGPAERLAQEAGLSLSALDKQLGNPAVVTLPDLVDLTVHRTPLVAWTVRDESALREAFGAGVDRKALVSAGEYQQASLFRAGDGQPAYALDGAVLLLGRDTDTLRRAIDRHARKRGMTTRDLAERLEGTPEGAPVRVSVNGPVALAGPDFAALRKVPWIAALERVSLSVEADAESVTATLAFDTSESDLVDADLPVATGPTAPPIPKTGALRIGLRNPEASLAFARRVWAAVDPEAARALEVASGPLALVGVDIDRDLLGNLPGPALLSTDLEESRLRVTLRDPEAFDGAVNRARFLVSPLLGAIGLEGLGLAALPDGSTQLSSEGVERGRLDVIGEALVAGTPQEILARIAEMPTERVAGAQGALVARLASDRLRATLARLVGLPARAGFALDGLGDGTLMVRSDPAEVRAVLQMDVG